MVCQEPTSTPTGMSRPRPLAASSAATAALSKASAPMPYTVSVGITTSRPPLSAPTAEAIPTERWSGSAQSKTAVMCAALPRKREVPPPHRLRSASSRRGSWPPLHILAGRHEPRPAGQIPAGLDVFEKPCLLDQFDSLCRCGVIVLDRQQAA